MCTSIVAVGKLEDEPSIGGGAGNHGVCEEALSSHDAPENVASLTDKQGQAQALHVLP